MARRLVVAAGVLLVACGGAGGGQADPGAGIPGDAWAEAPGDSVREDGDDPCACDPSWEDDGGPGVDASRDHGGDPDASGGEDATGDLDAAQGEDVAAPPPGPWAAVCDRGCGMDLDCGAAGKCLTFQDSAQTFCALPCLAAAPRCPDGYYCSAVDGADLCVPVAGECKAGSLGIDCNGTGLAGICKADYPVCTSTDWRPGYCTRDCDVTPKR